jgi:hypothetical protein
VLTCFDGQSLRNRCAVFLSRHRLFLLPPAHDLRLWRREMLGKQDPYCLVEFGDQRQRSNTVKNGGTNPYFNEEELELCVPPPCVRLLVNCMRTR